jgi:hypothetical protein
VAYPAGDFDDVVVRIAREEGYALGFTTVRGVNRIGRDDPLRLRRINVGQRSTLPMLRAQLTGWALELNRLHPLRSPNVGGAAD